MNNYGRDEYEKFLSRQISQQNWEEENPKTVKFLTVIGFIIALILTSPLFIITAIVFSFFGYLIFH